eukprot:11087187-Heterocapsa_arctica.AAC.1
MRNYSGAHAARWESLRSLAAGGADESVLEASVESCESRRASGSDAATLVAVALVAWCRD